MHHTELAAESNIERLWLGGHHTRALEVVPFKGTEALQRTVTDEFLLVSLVPLWISQG